MGVGTLFCPGVGNSPIKKIAWALPGGWSGLELTDTLPPALISLISSRGKLFCFLKSFGCFDDKGVKRCLKVKDYSLVNS